MIGACLRVCVSLCAGWMPFTLQGETVAPDSVPLRFPEERKKRVE